MATRLHDRQPDERELAAAVRRALWSGGAPDATGHFGRLAREAEEQARDRDGRRQSFPVCPFEGGATVPHLAELRAALPADADPSWVLDVLLAPSSSLDGPSPLEAARRGGAHLSRALHEHRGFGADGRCIAVFDRAARKLRPGRTWSPDDWRDFVSDFLDRCGKSVAG